MHNNEQNEILENMRFQLMIKTADCWISRKVTVRSPILLLKITFTTPTVTKFIVEDRNFKRTQTGISMIEGL